MSGVLAGMGGASLSVFLWSAFSRNMTAGRGFIALAALVFGKWKPVPTAIACLLFGFAEAVEIRLQGVSLWGGKPIPVQFIQILPYVVRAWYWPALWVVPVPPKPSAPYFSAGDPGQDTYFHA
jgi:ABC-type uncharacterized transport system permease subunit